MKSAPREARKTAAPMISSDFPQRLAGVRARISAFIGELRTAVVISVSIQPGAIALTWMLWLANSIAKDFVSCTIAPFAALYEGTSPDPKIEYILARLMIFPPLLRLTIDLATNCESRSEEHTS